MSNEPVLFSDPPPKTGEWSLNQIHQHKYAVGDRLCYFFRSSHGTRFQFTEAIVEATGYDRLRIPRYRLKVIQRVAIADGVLKTKKSQISRRNTPSAYQVEENAFPAEQWEQQIQWKLNLSRVNHRGH